MSTKTKQVTQSKRWSFSGYQGTIDELGSALQMKKIYHVIAQDPENPDTICGFLKLEKKKSPSYSIHLDVR